MRSFGNNSSRRGVFLQSGQSLIEILVGIALGALFVVAAATLIVPALKSNLSSTEVETAVSLAQELSDNVRVWSEGNWQNVLALATTSAKTYHLNASASPFSAVAGTETTTISGVLYTRYFYVDDVYRDNSDNIATTGTITYDPSTKQVTVAYSWVNVATRTLAAYLTRNRNNVYRQTDWSGGPNFSGPTSSTTSRFSTSTANMNYTSTTGAIFIKL